MIKRISVSCIIAILIASNAFADGGVVGIEPALDKDGHSIPEELNDFEYELVGNEIYFNSYKGDDQVITINGSYTIDGDTYVTNLNEFEASISRDVEAIIFGDGIKTLSHAMFNSSDVQKVFFPLSMEVVEDGTLSYLSPEEDNDYIQIYYEGTQEQWAQIFRKYEDMTVEKAEKAEDYGVAAADWLNNLFGLEYDSSQFEYFFSSTPEDLLNSMND